MNQNYEEKKEAFNRAKTEFDRVDRECDAELDRLDREGDDEQRRAYEEELDEVIRARREIDNAKKVEFDAVQKWKERIVKESQNMDVALDKVRLNCALEAAGYNTPAMHQAFSSCSSFQRGFATISGENADQLERNARAAKEQADSLKNNFESAEKSAASKRGQKVREAERRQEAEENAIEDRRDNAERILEEAKTQMEIAKQQMDQLQ